MPSVAPVMGAYGEMEIKPQLYAYESHQDIGGVVTLHLSPGKQVEHLGIKIQFIGRIDTVRVTHSALMALSNWSTSAN
jgi:hypothetical protein